MKKRRGYKTTTIARAKAAASKYRSDKKKARVQIDLLHGDIQGTEMNGKDVERQLEITKESLRIVGATGASNGRRVVLGAE